LLILAILAEAFSVAQALKPLKSLPFVSA